MESKTGLFTNLVMYAILAVSVILAILCVTEELPMSDGSWTGTIISWTGALLGLGLLGAICSEVVGALTDTTGLVKSLIALAAVVAVIGICWAMSDDTPLKLIGYEGDQNQGNWLKIADTSLFLTYIGLGGAVVAILVNELSNMFK